MLKNGLKVEHDGSADADPAEDCSICGQETRYWYRPRDVALCQPCAANAKAVDVPTKREWLNATVLPGQARLPYAWKRTQA